MGSADVKIGLVSAIAEPPAEPIGREWDAILRLQIALRANWTRVEHILEHVEQDV
jgi:hypothetical protein